MATRKEQKEQRRTEILHAGIDLFIRNGYSGTKIGDIAKHLNMSDGLLFHYFESKEALYVELVTMGLQGTQTPFQIALSDNPLMFFEGFVSQLFEHVKEHPWMAKMFTLMAQAQRNESIPPSVRAIANQVDTITPSAEIIKAGQKTGLIRQGDPLVLATTFWWCIQSVMENLAVNPDASLPKVEWLIDIIKEKGFYSKIDD